MAGKVRGFRVKDSLSYECVGGGGLFMKKVGMGNYRSMGLVALCLWMVVSLFPSVSVGSGWNYFVSHESLRDEVSMERVEMIERMKGYVVEIKRPVGEAGDLEAVSTGFFISPDLILTAFHCVGGDKYKTSYFHHNGRRFRGELIAESAELDIALIRTERYVYRDFSPIIFYDGAKAGDFVYILGNMRYVGIVALRGMIAKNDEIETLGGVYNGTVFGGNSGAPLLDEKGRVVGIMVSKHADFEGIGFFVLSSRVLVWLDGEGFK